MTREYSEIALRSQDLERSRPLSILQLSEPFTAPLQSDKAARSSDASNDVFDHQNPEELENDLDHYKQLFSKLRFSYLEQVTKEKFLRAIVGDPPLIVEHQENVELERDLTGAKALLKTQKVEVDDLVAELVAKGRNLAQRHETIKSDTAQLHGLPDSIDSLQRSISSLNKAQSEETNPSLRLPLGATQSILQERKLELAQLDEQIARLQSALPKKKRELDRLEMELKPLEAQRLGSSAAAREAQKRKEESQNGTGDDLEARARWWRSAEGGVREMLEIER